MKNNSIVYDKHADVLSIWFSGVTSEKTIDITEDIFVDIDNSGKLAGIEVLPASEKTNLLDLLTWNLKNKLRIKNSKSSFPM